MLMRLLRYRNINTIFTSSLLNGPEFFYETWYAYHISTPLRKNNWKKAKAILANEVYQSTLYKLKASVQRTRNPHIHNYLWVFPGPKLIWISIIGKIWGRDGGGDGLPPEAEFIGPGAEDHTEFDITFAGPNVLIERPGRILLTDPLSELHKVLGKFVIKFLRTMYPLRPKTDFIK